MPLRIEKCSVKFGCQKSSAFLPGMNIFSRALLAQINLLRAFTAQFNVLGANRVVLTLKRPAIMRLCK